MATDTNVKSLVLNRMTKAQYDAATKSTTELYLVPDSSKPIYYGTCSTAAGTAAKVVVCEGFVLETGATVRVKFTNANSHNGTATLNVNSTGAKNITRAGGTTSRFWWTANEVVDFVYNGTTWDMVDKGAASTTYYGLTKLSDSTSSTSTSLAATANAVKKAYDLANGKQNPLTAGTGIQIQNNVISSTTLKPFNYNRKGTSNTWAKVATTSLVGTWEEKHAYLFVKGTHNSNFKQNGIISIDAAGNAIKSKVKSYSAQFISASADLDVENFYIEYQDGDANTDATINFWVRITTNAYASWQFKILQNIGWTIESADTSATTLPTQDFTGKNAELSNVSLKAINDKNGNDITTTYVKNTDYASSSKGGVVKVSNANAVSVNSNTGTIYPSVLSYLQYTSGGDWVFISKGTLENVITGKGLVDQTNLATKQDVLTAGTGIQIQNNVISTTTQPFQYQVLSEDNYQALIDAGTVDENTLYFIKES